MANPIRRIVQLILDKNAAKKTERDAKKSLKGIETGLGKLKSAALRVGAAIGLAFGGRAIFRFLKDSATVGAEAEAVWNRLEHAVENAGVSYKAVEQDIHRTANAFQEATKVGDEDFATIMTELLTTTKDYEASLREVATVADLAAAKQVDLKAAAQLVGRAMAGQTGSLSRYGIIVEEGQDAMEVLRSQFAGFAANEAVTFEGKLVQLTNAWDDFKQAMGEAMIAGSDGATMFDRMTKSILSLAIAVDVFNRAYSGLSETAFANRQGIQRILTAAETPEKALIGLQAFQRLTEQELAAAQETLAGMTGTWNTIKGIAKTGDMFLWETEVESATETVQGLQETLASLERTMAGVSAGDINIGIASVTTPTAAPALGPLKIDADITPRIVGAQEVIDALEGDDVKITMPLHLDLSPVSQELMGLGDALGESEVINALLGDRFSQLQNDAWSLTTAMQNLVALGIGPTDDRMRGLVDRLRTVQDEMDMVTQQQQIMAEVAYATGDILNAAFGAGIGQLAASKAKQNAIMAAEQAVQGLVASLNPFTAPLAAGHFAAAGQFAGIAAAWGALAGATGGFSGGGGGGGAGGYSGGGRTAAGAASQDATPIGPELNIYFTGEGFDAVNPRVQRVVHTAMAAAQSNIGENARVRVFRGNIPTQGGG